jgi:mevalonate kinase
MRIVLRAAVLVAVALAVAVYTGTLQLPAADWIASASQKLRSLVSSSSPADKVTVSKWVDAKGVTHYENRPVDGAKTLEVDPNQNVLPPAPVIKLPEEKSAKPKTTNEEVQELQKAKDAYYESVINN